MTESGHVRRIEYEGREIHVIGTAHVSAKSVTEVETLIREVRPDTVCIELDDIRYRSLVDESYWRDLDVCRVIRERQVGFLLANTALASIQRRLGQKFGSKPGAEFLAAARTAREVGARVVLADRSVRITFQRTWANLAWFNRLRLVPALILAPFERIEDTIDEQDLEELKNQGTIADALTQLAKVMPEVQSPLIDERNQYMIAKVRNAPGKRIVAVVGAAHVQGMLDRLDDPVDVRELERQPVVPRRVTAFKWSFSLGLLGVLACGFWSRGPEMLERMTTTWIAVTGASTALLALTAGAKPLTLGAALLASPLASLTPALPVGVITGLVEARLRRPTAADSASMTADIQSLRGIYRNRFTRVLLVAVLSALGSRVGAWAALLWLLSLLISG